MTYKTTRYWKQLDISQRDFEEPTTGCMVKMCDLEEWERKEIMAELSEEFNYHKATKNSHYTALNCLPVAVGTKWVVSEDIYLEFLDMLPPIGLKDGGFAIIEASSGDIRSCYFRKDGAFWHEYRILKQEDTREY